MGGSALHTCGNMICVHRHCRLVVRVDKKLWVGSWLFENCNSLFGTQGTFFGVKCFDCTHGVALPDDAAGCSPTLVDWGWICVMELSCKVFGAWVRFLTELDKLLDFIEVLLHSGFELLVCSPCMVFLCCCIWLHGLLLNSCTCCCGHRHHFLQFCSCRAEVQSLGMEVKPTVSFLDGSPWKISLRLANL